MAAVMNSSFQNRIDEMEKRIKADTEAKVKARVPNTLIVETSKLRLPVVCVSIRAFSE